MKESPIIFSAPMVRAILSGCKTQARRAVKPQPDVAHDGEPYWNIGGYRAWRHRSVGDVLRMGGNEILCPYGAHGDRLWVREKWAKTPDSMCRYRGNLRSGRRWDIPPGELIYSADFADDEPTTPKLKWHSPRFMPRWASRLTLEATDVRVERLQDIDEDDLKAEGIHFKEYDFFNPPHREAFAGLWNSLYTRRSGYQWDANPWVWAISFRRLEEK